MKIQSGFSIFSSRNISVVLISACLLFLLAGISPVFAEDSISGSNSTPSVVTSLSASSVSPAGADVSSATKEKTQITAKVSPSNPNPGETVKVTGQLVDADGKPLAAKKVLLETSDRMGNRSDFEITGKEETDEKGYFEFLVGGGSTTTFILIHFTGDDSCEESYSDMITVI
ncbi:MAG: hypothetical protein LUQ07_01920 [Methanospirillum sp.]|nr:hypothetical protein [Methanospirillum sp.]